MKCIHIWKWYNFSQQILLQLHFVSSSRFVILGPLLVPHSAACLLLEHIPLFHVHARLAMQMDLAQASALPGRTMRQLSDESHCLLPRVCLDILLELTCRTRFRVIRGDKAANLDLYIFGTIFKLYLMRLFEHNPSDNSSSKWEDLRLWRSEKTHIYDFLFILIDISTIDLHQRNHSWGDEMFEATMNIDM
jgi:hypothetical protein